MAKLVLILGGCAGHGKDTVAGFMVERLATLKTSVRTDAYAWALKQIVHLKYGVPLHTLNSTKEVKESTYFYGKSVRKLLQDEGEYARQTCGASVWADRVYDRLTTANEQVTIITDARHPVEEIINMRPRVQASAGTKCVAVRIVNPSVPVVRGHPSEDLIADAPNNIFDFVLTNDASLEDLQRLSHDIVDASLMLCQLNVSKLSASTVAYSVDGTGWPYPLRSDAEATIANTTGRVIVARSFSHLKGSAIRG